MLFNKYLDVINQEFLRRQFADLKLLYPKLGVLALLPEAEHSQVGEIQLSCLEANVPLLGAIFPKLISNQKFVDQGVWLIGFEICPAWFLVEDAGTAQTNKHALIDQTITQTLEAHPALAHSDAKPTLFMIFDSMTPTIGSVLTGIYEKFRRSIRYAGVNAGSETFSPMPCLFDHARVVSNGLLGIILPPTLNTYLCHGYPTPKKTMTATSTSGNAIDTIDGRPAMAVYREVIREEYGIEVTHENFYDYAVHYPFGVISALEILVRIPVGFNEDGSIFCVGEIPPNSRLHLLKAPQLKESECVSTLSKTIRENKKPLDSALLFYCAGRRMHFGNESEDEILQFKTHAGIGQLAGALSLGEITSDNVVNFPEFHNAALICVS